VSDLRLSTIINLLKTIVSMPGGAQISPISQANALAYEKAWHILLFVLKIKPILADPAVLFASTLV
jgi:hypothetical protein